jgi:hypothetical protein
MSTNCGRPVAAKFGSFLLWMIAICTYNHKIEKEKTPDRLHTTYTPCKLELGFGNWN